MTQHEARIAATLQHILDQGYRRATIEVQLGSGKVTSLGGFPLQGAARSRSALTVFAKALAVVAAAAEGRSTATLNLETGSIVFPPREESCQAILEGE